MVSVLSMATKRGSYARRRTEVKRDEKRQRVRSSDTRKADFQSVQVSGFRRHTPTTPPDEKLRIDRQFTVEAIISRERVIRRAKLQGLIKATKSDTAKSLIEWGAAHGLIKFSTKPEPTTKRKEISQYVFSFFNEVYYRRPNPIQRAISATRRAITSIVEAIQLELPLDGVK